MNILLWILVGFIGGTIARWLMPGRDPGGILLTIALGIVGALLGGFIAVSMGISNGVDDFDIGTIVLSVIGSMIILAIYRAFVGPRRGWF